MTSYHAFGLSFFRGFSFKIGADQNVDILLKIEASSPKWSQILADFEIYLKVGTSWLLTTPLDFLFLEVLVSKGFVQNAKFGDFKFLVSAKMLTFYSQLKPRAQNKARFLQISKFTWKYVLPDFLPRLWTFFF